MKDKRIFLSVVIPAYNEEDRIHKSLESTIAYLRKQPYESEIIVVSDGSTDKTVDVVRRYKDKFENLRIIEYFPNKGKGKAVKTGMIAAKGEYILFMDADYSVPIEEIEKAFRFVNEEEFDIAIGSRGLKGTIIEQGQSKLREVAGKIYGKIQNLWLGINFEDTQCGFKLFSRKTAQILFPKQRLNSVIFDGEILFLAYRAGLKVKEFPVRWIHDPESRIKYDPIKSLKVFWELLKVRLLHLRD